MKASMRYHYIYTTKVKIKPLTKLSVGEDMEQVELSYMTMLLLLFGGLHCFLKGTYMDKLHP